MKITQLITASLLNAFKSREGYVEIFVNPDRSEVKDHVFMRFIADAKEKDVYVWDGFIMHVTIMHKVDLPWINKEGTVCSGIIKKVGGKWYMEHADMFSYDDSDVLAVLKHDWSWMEKHNIFGIQKYFEGMKKERKL